MNRVETIPIADVQNFPDHRRLAIDKVGIKSIRHLIAVRDKSGVQRTIATFNLSVHLPHHLKGTHMSRFVALLGQTREISVDGFEPLLRDMLARLEAEAGSIEVRFPYFINKAAPVSGVESLMDYDVTLSGEIKAGQFSLTTKALVAATSLCPCSKAISDYGAHNQRSHVTVSIQSNAGIWIEDIVRLVEAEASCEVYGLLKRPDEKYVTERAYDNPKFVEDMVRDVAARLGEDERITAFEVEVENFESIHNHSAFAVISGRVLSIPGSTKKRGE